MRPLSIGTVCFLFVTTWWQVGTSGAEPGTTPIETFDENTDRGSIVAELSILSKVDDAKWTRKRAIYPVAGQEVTLAVKPIVDGEIRWYLVFADLTQNYNNANRPRTENAYKWVGYDTISYHRVELQQFRGLWNVKPFVADGDLFKLVRSWFEGNGFEGKALDFYNGETGTYWFQAEVEKGDKTIRSRGLDDIGTRGISRKVLRVSIRRSLDYMGYLTSFYNVPGIFGSVPYQSINYIGADCADVLMAAWSKWKRSPLKRNFNVQAMVGKFKKVAEFEMKKGVPDKSISWSEQVKPGDFIAVGHGEGRIKYHHVGALYEDTDGDGLLGAADLVIHAGPDPLHLSKLNKGSFDGHVVILKNR